eukprot:CAMPEP_0174366580 /NCGR_PEP_ID=MMETSP0811_2-20130205/81735_1 /TAXON_ID=73025 ORGANISM="Eutreptiella gymnastica-like, Strain CCMP1594" /NCGR_SAMPLE_ID=MMETSP0811_2 /ASSEMBLY_ACC=CAM_ASM_000667 /LENGTH=99 /DNA_ID=CAMNT_0015508279 /DNA_START=18 /DNA_END=315 /DNA_ORIENTATION=+
MVDLMQNRSLFRPFLDFLRKVGMGFAERMVPPYFGYGGFKNQGPMAKETVAGLCEVWKYRTVYPFLAASLLPSHASQPLRCPLGSCPATTAGVGQPFLS